LVLTKYIKWIGHQDLSLLEVSFIP
jgi:hypothetical protein